MTSEPLERKVVSPEQWDTRWETEKDPRFHRKVYSPYLERFYDQAFGSGSSKRIFVPLCGKTLDLIFLADKGHEVVGLEFSNFAVESFFCENNLTFTKTKVENLPLVKYESKEKSILIFQGDLFDLEPAVCGQFDGVWDRGSYVAINVEARMTYIQLMSDILKPGAKMLLEAYDYDPTKFPGPPHFTTEESVRSLFGENFEVDALLVDKDYEAPHFKALGMGFMARIFMLTKK